MLMLQASAIMAFCKSSYMLELSGESRARYELKLTSCGLQCDPYIIPDSAWTRKPDKLPSLAWSDLAIYMITTPSPYTKETIKAWKGMLDSQAAGFIQDMKLHTYNKGMEGKCNCYIVMGKVKHSQRTSAPALLPWVVIEEDGSVLAAHCTCMAGLGEACTHVASILSCVVQAVNARLQSGEGSCTSKPCTWLPALKQVAPANISDISFVNPRKRCCSRETDSKCNKQVSQVEISPPSVAELDCFMEKISEAKHKPALLKITMPYANDFIPKLSNSKFPKPIPDLYDCSKLSAGYLELVNESERIFSTLEITCQHIDNVEKETRGQSCKRSWFIFRAGRITASMMKVATKTNSSMPSVSLIKRICNPEAYTFSTMATRWGCEHERDAIDLYMNERSKHHQNLTFTEVGFIIDSVHPFIGATPDGRIECSCCGKGILEVKCPMCVKDSLPAEGNELSQFCMEMYNDLWKLKNDHTYYYQVQTQLHVCKVSFCDFVVWSEKEGVIVERIHPDKDFFEMVREKVKHFFIYGILPEIIGKWYTRVPVANSEGIVSTPEKDDHVLNEASDNEDYTKLWCYCNQPSHGLMVKCEHSNCQIQWFHCECLRIRKPPKGKWHCPSCNKISKKKKQLTTLAH